MEFIVVRVNGFYLFLIDVHIILELLLSFTVHEFLLFRLGGVHTHQEQLGLIMLLDDLQGFRGLEVNFLLYVVDGIPIFMLTCDISLLFVGHAFLKFFSTILLLLVPFPYLLILGFPVLSCHGDCQVLLLYGAPASHWMTTLPTQKSMGTLLSTMIFFFYVGEDLRSVTRNF